MRTTINIDDDLLAKATKLARIVLERRDWFAMLRGVGGVRSEDWNRRALASYTAVVWRGAIPQASGPCGNGYTDESEVANMHGRA